MHIYIHKHASHYVMIQISIDSNKYCEIHNVNSCFIYTQVHINRNKNVHIHGCMHECRHAYICMHGCGTHVHTLVYTLKITEIVHNCAHVYTPKTICTVAVIFSLRMSPCCYTLLCVLP